MHTKFKMVFVVMCMNFLQAEAKFPEIIDAEEQINVGSMVRILDAWTKGTKTVTLDGQKYDIKFNIFQEVEDVQCQWRMLTQAMPKKKVVAPFALKQAVVLTWWGVNDYLEKATELRQMLNEALVEGRPGEVTRCLKCVKPVSDTSNVDVTFPVKKLTKSGMLFDRMQLKKTKAGKNKMRYCFNLGGDVESKSSQIGFILTSK